MNETDKLHTGHRARMKRKFLLQDPRLFATYELLEMLLYYVIPQRDTKPTAKKLLIEFSSLEGVLGSSAEKLAGVSGIGDKTARFIVNTGELLRRIATTEHRGEAPICDVYEQVGEAFVDCFKNEKDSAVLVMLLDNAKRLVSIERLFECDLGAGGVRTEKIIEAALAKGAPLIITAHNHPFGPLFATQGDMATVSMLEKELRPAGISALEHYVISGNSYVGVKESLNCFSGNDKLKSLGKKANTQKEPSLFSQTYERGGQTELLYQVFSAFLPCEHASFISEALIDGYYNLCGVFTASIYDVAQTLGTRWEKYAVFIKLLSALNSRRITDGFPLAKTYGDEELSEYLKGLFFGRNNETVYMLAFDKADRLIAVEYVSDGTVNSCDVNPRKLLECAKLTSAVSVALAHNHPRGRALPSTEDKEITERLYSIFRTAGINLKAHYVVTVNSCTKLKPVTFSEN